ncbi:MAG TPA: polymer-forming cytoskeletal protein [Bryobacteraceae bacterium]|nr:polymer-forming cytoskeletal protein [Bryobacteraceae bacterium]
MWNKEAQPEIPGTSQNRDSRVPGAPANGPVSIRPNGPAARPLACLGPSVVVKGQITSEEDLQIDGTVEGPIAIRSHRLTVGRTAQLDSEISAREVVVYGNAAGNLRAADRVEIKKDGQVIGNIISKRISIEEGAYFKGHIEIVRAQSSTQESDAEEPISIGAGAD